MKEVTRHTIKRQPDDPKLRIGDRISIRDGVTGVVLARYVPSGGKRNEVCYVVEEISSEVEEKKP